LSSFITCNFKLKKKKKLNGADWHLTSFSENFTGEDIREPIVS
jgi:hypothetical protein